MKRATPRSEERFRKYLNSELESAAIYRALASKEQDERRAAILKDLAVAEMRHASHWAARLGLDAASLEPQVTSRVRFVGWLARLLGNRAVLPLVLRREFADIRAYAKDPEAGAIVGDERNHAQAVGGLTTPEGAAETMVSEARHRVGSAGNIRAAVLGFNDGLVSISALVIGVSGGTSDSRIILLAGVAGLLAGAFSMAAGEYLSVRTQVDVFQREVEIERAEIAEAPRQEWEELVQIYRSKGLNKEEAEAVATRIVANPRVVLDTMAREELGLDPSQLGSPWAVAVSSFVAFCLGAFFPLAPHVFASGGLALILSIIVSGLALLATGGTLALLSRKNPAWGAVRMLLIGTASASVTFGIGRLLGVSVAS